MCKIVLVVAGSLGISAAVFADGANAGNNWHLEPIPALKPYDASHCLRETGTRITHVNNNETPCIAANGRVFENEDLDAGGALTLGQVLGRDPSISIVHR